MVKGRCPACQTRVSETATNCPYCGYQDNELHIPIVLSKYTPFRRAWDVTEVRSPIDRLIVEQIMSTESFQQVFGSANNLTQVAPAFTEFIKALHPHDVKIAKITDEMQHLIDNGGLSFRFDKNGEMLAQLTRGDGRVSNNLRLRDISLTPELGPALVNLQAQLTMMQILDELRTIQQGINELRRSLQDDRLAIIDSVWDQLSQAVKIQDSRLQEEKFLDALARATDAKCQLIRTFERDCATLEAQRNRSAFSRLIQKGAREEGEVNSGESLVSLAAITRAVEIEVATYSLLGEEESARISLEQFVDFTTRNKLDNRDTLLHITSFSSSDITAHIDLFLERIDEIKALTSGQAYAGTLLLESSHEKEDNV